MRTLIFIPISDNIVEDVKKNSQNSAKKWYTLIYIYKETDHHTLNEIKTFVEKTTIYKKVNNQNSVIILIKIYKTYEV